jgi:hypothetical protein
MKNEDIAKIEDAQGRKKAIEEIDANIKTFENDVNYGIERI